MPLACPGACQPERKHGANQMSTRVQLSALLFVVAAFVTGCGQKTNHDKIREDARDRMNLVNAQVTYNQAEQYFETGQFDRALREINAAIARYPKSCTFYVLQGRIHLEAKRLEPAMTSLKLGIQAGRDACGIDSESPIEEQTAKEITAEPPMAKATGKPERIPANKKRKTIRSPISTPSSPNNIYRAP
jgi:hypothetical protein